MKGKRKKNVPAAVSNIKKRSGGGDSSCTGITELQKECDGGNLLHRQAASRRDIMCSSTNSFVELHRLQQQQPSSQKEIRVATPAAAAGGSARRSSNC